MIADAKLDLSRALDERAAASGSTELALRFAALSGPFDPERALAFAGVVAPCGDSPDVEAALDRLAVIAALSDACDTQIWRPEWIMRSAARERVIEAGASNLPALVAWRRGLLDFADVQAPSNICEALLGEGDFAPEKIDALLAKGDATDDEYRKLIRGLTFAGSVAPAASRLDGLRAGLARLTSEANSELLEQGVIGRDAELARIRASIAHQWASGGGGRAIDLFYVGGIGGVGKSTLLAETRRTARIDHRALCLALDFDRPGIEGGDPLGLSLEIARQLAETAGAEAASLYAARLASVGGQTTTKRSDRTPSQELIAEIAQVMRRLDQPILLALDTLEALTLRGDIAAIEFVDWLWALKRALPRLAIVAAGRDDLPPGFAGLGEKMLLTGLGEEAARAVVARHGVTGVAADQLVALAQGNPLLLRLGARLVREAGGAALDGEALGDHVSSQIRAGQLYRMILSRIEAPAVRAIAHPGLLLRVLNARLISEVLAPELALTRIDPPEAEQLLAELKRYAWLVEEKGGWLVHRQDLRNVLLESQIAENPERARRLFAAAEKWHQRAGNDEANSLLALYYRLQQARWRKRVAAIDKDLAARFPAAVMNELPQLARDALALARGERSSRLRAAAPAAKTARATPMRELDPGEAQEIATMIQRRNLGEAALMAGRADRFNRIAATSPEGAAVVEALWRCGGWRRAGALLARRENEMAAAASFAAWPALLAVEADLAPMRLRRRLRADAEIAEIAGGWIARAGPGDPDADVVALLARGEGLEVAHGLAHAAWTLSTAAPPSPEQLGILEADLRGGSGRWFGTAAGPPLPGDASPSPGALLDRLVGAVLPDPARREIVLNRLRARMPGDAMHDVAELALATARARGGLADELATRFVGYNALDQIDLLGGLAPFVAVLALHDPGLGLDRIADAVRRRAATLGGFWSFGPAPAGWRQPATDRATAQALARLCATGSLPGQAAQAQLAAWRHGDPAGPEPCLARFVRRGEALAAGVSVPLFGERPDVTLVTAQAMIEAGLPLELVAPFAVAAAATSALTAPAAIEVTPAPSPPGATHA